MKHRFRCAVMVLVILFTSISSQESWAATPYYEGKVLKIIVGFAPGGGYDRMSRLLAKHLPRYIPGKPTIIIENMAGANSMIAANYLYNIAKPDGLAIGAINNGLPFAQLLKADGARFDLTKYAWVGSSASEAHVFTILADLPYKTFDDLRKSGATLYTGGCGPADSAAQFTLILKEFTGLNTKEITYPTYAEALLSIERKEVKGLAGSYTSLKPLINRGILRPLVRSRTAEPEIEKLPVNEDLTTDAMGKTIMAMHATPGRIGRPYVAPPKSPEAVMNILRDAFAKVDLDPAYREDAKKLMLSTSYVSARDCLQVLQYVLNQPKDIVKEFSKYIKF